MEESAAMNTPKETITAVTKNEDQCTRMVEKIKDALDQSQKINLRSSSTCIYRVPDLLRKVNEQAYTPQLISIGPFHYRSPKLQFMENFKLRFLENFMKRADIKLEDLVSIIKDSEQSVRECYEGTIEIESDDFMKMILVDACFIIEFFLRQVSPELLTDPGDFIEFKVWHNIRMRLDLMLLENQIPLFIINKLYVLLPLKSPAIYASSFLEIAFKIYEILNNQEKCPDDPDSAEIRHIVDMLRYFCLPPRQSLPGRRIDVITEMYSVSQLAEAGLKFKPSSSRCLIDLKLNDRVLEIPPFTLNKRLGLLARNLIALEQCHYHDEAYVTDYFVMLDFLINTGKDVDLLVQEKIIVNVMGTDSTPTLPTKLSTGISQWSINADYSVLSRQLVDFRRKNWYAILKSSLKQDYFRTPWIGAATVGAVILLILTLIQTVCTVISIFT